MDENTEKLIAALCVIFGIMTSIIISNKFHKATSFFERVVGVILGSIGFFFTYDKFNCSKVATLILRQEKKQILSLI